MLLCSNNIPVIIVVYSCIVCATLVVLNIIVLRRRFMKESLFRTCAAFKRWIFRSVHVSSSRSAIIIAHLKSVYDRNGDDDEHGGRKICGCQSILALSVVVL